MELKKEMKMKKWERIYLKASSANKRNNLLKVKRKKRKNKKENL